MKAMQQRRSSRFNREVIKHLMNEVGGDEYNNQDSILLEQDDNNSPNLSENSETSEPKEIAPFNQQPQGDGDDEEEEDNVEEDINFGDFTPGTNNPKLQELPKHFAVLPVKPSLLSSNGLPS